MPVMTTRRPGEDILATLYWLRLGATRAGAGPPEIQRMSRILVWLGGAVFVASLGLCTWWYLTVLGEPGPWNGWVPLLVNIALLTIFALHHSLFARDRVKAWLTRVVPAPRSDPPTCLDRQHAADRRLPCVAARWRYVVRGARRPRRRARGVSAVRDLAHRAIGRRHRPARARGHPRAGGTWRTANLGPVRLGAAPAVPRLDAGRVRRRAHDRRPPGIRGDHDGVSDGRGAVGGAIARAQLRGRVPGVSAARTLADHSLRMFEEWGSGCHEGPNAYESLCKV